MKNTFIAFSAIFALCCFSPNLFAGDEPEPVVLTEIVDGSFGKVWRSVKSAMEKFGCPKPQTEKIIEPAEEGGLYKGQYISDYCVISEGDDTTKSVINKYSSVPRIRGGIWVTCRVQFRVSVREEANGKTKIVLKAEMSGFEEFITAANHFWTSNGMLERQMMERVLAAVAEELQKANE